MKTTITNSAFIDAFQSIRPDNFSYNGLNALFDYLEEYEDSTGEEIDLDVIALCCDYTEYESLEDILKNHTELDCKIEIEDLYHHTQVIEFEGGIIIQNF